jgi:hypothetical protein
MLLSQSALEAPPSYFCQNSTVENTLTITETAQRLGVSRHKVRTLVKDGMLTTRRNPLDKCEKLIPVDAVERLAAGRKPVQRPYPSSIGIVADGTLPSSESEEYMRAHFHRLR